MLLFHISQLSLDLSPPPFPLPLQYVAARMPMPSSKDTSKWRLWQKLLSGSQTRTRTRTHTHTHTHTRTHKHAHMHTHSSSYAFISRPGNAHWLQHISTGITKVTSGSQGYRRSRLWKCRNWVWPKSTWSTSSCQRFHNQGQSTMLQDTFIWIHNKSVAACQGFTEPTYYRFNDSKTSLCQMWKAVFSNPSSLAQLYFSYLLWRKSCSFPSTVISWFCLTSRTKPFLRIQVCGLIPCTSARLLPPFYTRLVSIQQMGVCPELTGISDASI